MHCCRLPPFPIPSITKSFPLARVSPSSVGYKLPCGLDHPSLGNLGPDWTELGCEVAIAIWALLTLLEVILLRSSLPGFCYGGLGPESFGA